MPTTITTPMPDNATPEQLKNQAHFFLSCIDVYQGNFGHDPEWGTSMRTEADALIAEARRRVWNRVTPKATSTLLREQADHLEGCLEDALAGNGYGKPDHAVTAAYIDDLRAEADELDAACDAHGNDQEAATL